jgi:hypothetical protein
MSFSTAFHTNIPDPCDEQPLLRNPERAAWLHAPVPSSQSLDHQCRERTALRGEVLIPEDFTSKSLRINILLGSEAIHAA